MKKKRHIEAIEETKPAYKEHIWVNVPRGKLENVTRYSSNVRAYEKIKQTKRWWKQNNKQPYAHTHSHPYQTSSELKIGEAFPSGGDIWTFIENDDLKTMRIATTNKKTGEVYGIFLLRKTKDTPPAYAQFQRESNPIIRNIKEVWYALSSLGEREIPYQDPFDRYAEARNIAIQWPSNEMFEMMERSLKEIAKKYHLQYRFVPVKGRVSNLSDFPRSVVKRKNLEQKLATMGIVSSVVSIILSGISITGHVVSNVSFLSLNFAGGIAFVIAVLSLLAASRVKR